MRGETAEEGGGDDGGGGILVGFCQGKVWEKKRDINLGEKYR